LKFKLLRAYVAQAYVSLIGIVLMPLYLYYLGAEAFGLVGFYLMLQAWMQILDMGLTPVLSREMSRFRAGALSTREAAVRLRTLEVLQGVMAVSALAIIWAVSSWAGRAWFSAGDISEETLARCITLIGFAAVLRWLSGLYRAALAGLEQPDLVNGLSVGFATLRFGGVLPLLVYVSNSPEYFFAFQALAGGIELASFAWIVHRLIPGRVGIRADRQALASMLPMVGSMSFLTAMWVVMTQVDKLILSGLLPLKEYGYFTFAIMAASGVLVLVPPLNQVVQPRLTILVERGDEKALTELYRLTSQLAVIMFVALGGGLAFFAEPILRIWSGSSEVAVAVAPVLFWYGLANALVGILVLPFMLQFARGHLRLHVLGNLILLLTLVPALVLAAQHSGAVGAGQVFFFTNLVFLLFWIPLVHRRYLPVLTWQWSLRDILPIALVVGGALALSSQVVPNASQAPATLVWIGMAVIAAASMGIAVGDRSRPLVIHWFSGAKK
jgi:O-antigen/teichoic acid export membrane protein